ncbi:unnamed protein product [Dibothriocephalus latus]|uniref:Uncharacterized protein n=1 Tax=Dibothriocephalus latus TaxID=60516 RepID=A0A3P6VD54_DIBLA|nr:unnamed protein product [Dibothriocephalus latus]
MTIEGAQLTESTMNASLPPPADSPIPPDSIDTMCMLLNNDPASGDHDNDKPPEPKVARSIALAILSRISRLLGDSIDSCLHRILPTEAALLTSFSPTTHRLTTSPATQASNPVYESLLVAWGQNSLTNLRNASKQGFVHGIPVISVIRPSCLALLEALASWPSDQTRISLLESADTLMDDFLSSAAAGFYPLPWPLESLEPFQRLVGIILQDSGKENMTPSREYATGAAAYGLSVDALATSTVAKSELFLYFARSTAVALMDWFGLESRFSWCRPQGLVTVDLQTRETHDFRKKILTTRNLPTLYSTVLQQ